MLANWTSNRWVAVPHRVRNRDADEHRTDWFSLAFFHPANLDAVIEAIPTRTGPGNLPRFEPVIWYDWNDRRTAEHRH
jgi:isopenicillin N synthase-like dioxygenase